MSKHSQAEELRCTKIFVKMLVDGMNQLGWLADKQGGTTEVPLSANSQLSTEPVLPTETCIADYDPVKKEIQIELYPGVVGNTYEIGLVNANGKKLVANQIALYVAIGQKFSIKYSISSDTGPLYVTLKASKKGFINSEISLNQLIT